MGGCAELFFGDRLALHAGDMLAVLPTLPPETVDSCVTDPPYHLQSIHDRFAVKGRDETPERYAAGPYGRHATGFMGKQWDGGDVAFQVATWREVFRVLKPGAHLLAFGGTRTCHRMACAIEDAGFEIRDCIMWVYGSGFPKSHDVSKAIDRAAGAEREVVGRYQPPGMDKPWNLKNAKDERDVTVFASSRNNLDITAPATDEAAKWEGWGTALKPACEMIVLARKPLDGTVAANVVKWGTGALNIDACRVPTAEPQEMRARNNGATMGYHGCDKPFSPEGHAGGRWPANVITDGSTEVLAAFPDVGISAGGGMKDLRKGKLFQGDTNPNVTDHCGFGDFGSAARFFYTAKADGDDRLGSEHPTVKPLDLIQYLVRLVTPPGGIVLDPFAGTGTTGEAAWREGMRAVLIEAEPEYQADIRRRMALILAGPDERAREVGKRKAERKPPDPLPLFGGALDSREEIAG